MWRPMWRPLGGCAVLCWPSPGWGPVRVGAHMGPYGAHMGPPGQVRTWPNQDFWSNLVRFGSRNGILTKFHNDSASFLLEKLKNQVILTKNPNIWLKIQKKSRNSQKFLGIPRDLCGGPMWRTYVEDLFERAGQTLQVPARGAGALRAGGIHWGFGDT